MTSRPGSMVKMLRLTAALAVATVGCVHEHVVAPTGAVSSHGPERSSLLAGVSDTTRGPLYILDGVVVPESTRFDSLKIRSVEVIKGRRAVEIYGARAAGGVVLITTR